MENWKEIKEKSVKGEERNLVRGRRRKEGRKSERKRWVGGSLREYPMPKPHVRPRPEFHLEDMT